MTSATSSGLATLPRGCILPQFSRVSSTLSPPLNRSADHRSIGVSTEAGQTAFTLMFSSAWSRAIARVRALIPPLLAV
jgi:hypothetical protein